VLPLALLFAVGWLPSVLRRKQPDCSPPVDAVGRHTEKGISPSHRANGVSQRRAPRSFDGEMP